MTALVVLGVAFTIMMLGAGINEILTKMFGKQAAYVIMLTLVGLLILWLGLSGAGPTIETVRVGLLVASLTFTILLARRSA
jgi:spore maturation protein SpmA